MLVFPVVTTVAALAPWTLRALLSFENTAGDLKILALVYLCTNFKQVLAFSAEILHRQWWLLISLVPFAIHWIINSSSRSRKKTTATFNPNKSPLKPQLLPCRTTHTRLFPKKHSFSYSYLLAGIPVGWSGSANGILSADASIKDSSWSQRKAWFTVSAADHLDRGQASLGLRGKLDIYLRSQNADPEKYPHVYLVTAPRFLGYSFNPVSFWYLYSQDMELTAMILEVNNTFDERRMYFLSKGQTLPLDPVLPAGPEEREVEAIEQEGHKKTSSKFTQTWDKDFHVSPFNSRKGSYSLIAEDPLHEAFNNTITLLSSKDHSKLVARVFSTAPAIDVESMTRFELMKFIASWWWTGFFTFPRILREAARLFFQKGLYVWFRPEVLTSSVGRKETQTEAILETHFRAYLKDRVQKAGPALRLRYVSAGEHCVREEVFESIGQRAIDQRRSEEVTLQVLTPAFYADFVRYAHIVEAVSRLLLCPEEKERMAWVSDPKLLPLIFEEFTHEKGGKAPHTPQQHHHRLGKYRWSLLRRLRRAPTVSTPLAESNAAKVLDIRYFPFSSLDRFIMASEDLPQKKEQYRKSAMKVLLSDWIAFGEPALLTAYDWILRVGLAYAFLVTAAGLVDSRLTNVQAVPGTWISHVACISGLNVWALVKSVL